MLHFLTALDACPGHCAGECPAAPTFLWLSKRHKFSYTAREIIHHQPLVQNLREVECLDCRVLVCMAIQTNALDTLKYLFTSGLMPDFGKYVQWAINHDHRAVLPWLTFIYTHCYGNP